MADKPPRKRRVQRPAPDGTDPVRRAWDACTEPVVMTELLRALKIRPRVSVQTYGLDHSRYRTDGADERQTYVFVDGKPLAQIGRAHV